jgi:hypothetical protein
VASSLPVFKIIQQSISDWFAPFVLVYPKFALAAVPHSGHFPQRRGCHLKRSSSPHDLQLSWHLIPGATFEHAPGLLLVRPAPLLEKERDPSPQTLIADVRHPDLLQRTRTGTGFAAHDRPLDAFEIQLAIKLQAFSR